MYDKVLRRATRSVHRRATLVGEHTAGPPKTSSPGSNGQTSWSPGSNRQTSSSPGSNGQTSSSPGSNGQTSSSPGSNGQTS